MQRVSQTDEDLLREFINEHFRHAVSPHERTSDSKKVLRVMQQDKLLQKAFDRINNPRELASVLEELIDATGMSREEIQHALAILFKHEKPRGT